VIYAPSEGPPKKLLGKENKLNKALTRDKKNNPKKQRTTDNRQ
jgi:hypothetical protein